MYCYTATDRHKIHITGLLVYIFFVLLEGLDSTALQNKAIFSVSCFSQLMGKVQRRCQKQQW
jgi:hypothetical protein